MELRATLYPGDPSGDVVSASAAVDGPADVAAFLERTVALAESERPASLLLERGYDLEPAPGASAADLAEFRFGGHAGAGLDAARASWLRAYLQALGAHLDERPAGALTLFTDARLAAAEGRDEPAPDDPLGGELFVAWRAGWDDVAEACWVEACDAVPVREALPAEPLDLDALLAALCDELRALGLQAAPLDVAPALVVLPLLAHPAEARAELGAERYERAHALATRVTDLPAEDLGAGDRQALELFAFGALTFMGGERRALVRLQEPGVIALSSDGDVAAAVARGVARAAR